MGDLAANKYSTVLQSRRMRKSIPSLAVAHPKVIIRRKAAHRSNRRGRASPDRGFYLVRFVVYPILSMKYLTILRKTQYGYDVHVPALPGCHSQGDIEAEALANIKDAIKTYLAMDAIAVKNVEVREVEVAFAY